MREWLAAPTESNWSSFPKEFLRKRFMIGTYWYYLFLTPMVVSSKKVPLMEINSCRRWSWWFFNASTAVWRTQVFHKAKCTCFACARGEGPLVIDVTMYQIGLGVLATLRCSPRLWGTARRAAARPSPWWDLPSARWKSKGRSSPRRPCLEWGIPWN